LPAVRFADTSFRVRRLSALLICLAAGAARADENDLQLWKLGHPDPLSCTRCDGSPGDEIGDYGPGWEYYLDMLVAARDDLPTPSFDDYYPAMKGYYEALPTQTDPA